MVEGGEPHDIFVVNPLESLSYVERFVKMVLENGEVITGTVYTIDPVSQSVILVNREATGELSMTIVLKHAVSSLEILPDVPVEQQNVLTQDILKSEKFVCNKNFKDDVKNWLLKNMIPVVESGDKLLVDTLEICPPYGADQCYCSNPIVLSRIQNLLKEMPALKS